MLTPWLHMSLYTSSHVLTATGFTLPHRANPRWFSFALHYDVLSEC
jgi:hypothetical protein